MLGKLTSFTRMEYLPDFAVLSLAWLSDDTPSGNWNPDCDISEPPDGVIDELDLAVFSNNWLEGVE